GSTTVSAQLPVDGTYTIVVDPQSNATGSATLTLTDPPMAMADLVDHPAARHTGALKPSTRAARVVRGAAAPQAKPPAPPVNFDPPDAEDFTPGPGQRTGDWRRHLPHSPWSSIAPLRAPGGVTALSGQTLTLNGKPLADVTVELEDTSLST